ncbi:MAG TPA: hypothetical protein VM913_00670 [Sphingomicrobium sp.]|nr:hypothetical protein [Sphingomicrobium sp.]
MATAITPHAVTQAEAKAKARELFSGRPALFNRVQGVFENAGIDQRDLVAPVDWYEREHRWQARNNLYLQASEALFVKVAAKVISAY